MKEEIISIKNEATAQIMEAKSLNELEGLRIAYFGRSGKFTQALKQLKNVALDDKKMVGITINQSKEIIESLLRQQKNKLTTNSRIWFDPTIPGIKPTIGSLHLVTRAIEEITNVFNSIGFVRVRYPEVDWDWYAFESLNMPVGHAARDEWETFFVDTPKDPKLGQMVLTPHTSNGQVREMERVKNLTTQGGPPIRMINIAKCYRRQSDVSHVAMFHQFEGLVVDKNITIANLKGTLDYFARNFFGKDRKTRLRPYHFQFTEPSFEVDISCNICNGSGLINNDKCRLCKAGWLELGGAGMVHPVVLKNGGIDPKIYSGFAFGWGVERTYMMKAGLAIPDVRLLYSPDIRFHNQF